MLKVLGFVCLAVMAVSAYDFSDTYFNQFLFNEYEMLNAKTQTRHRRDVAELSADELAKEIVEAVDEDTSMKDAGGKLSSLVVLQTLNPEKVDALLHGDKLVKLEEVMLEDPTTEQPHAEAPEMVEEHTTEAHEKIEEPTTTTTTTTHKPTSTTTHKTTTTTTAKPTTTTPKTTTTTTHKPTTTTVKTTLRTTQAYKPPVTTTRAAWQDEKSLQCKDAMTEMKNDLTCCDANRHDPAYFAMLRGTKKQCATKLRTNNPVVENFDPFNCDDTEKIKQLIICESECVAKSLNMLDEHGDIRREAVISNFKKQLNDIEDSKIKSFEVYLDKCLAKMKELTMHSEKGKCSPVPMEFQHCMFGEMVVGCPKEHQVNTPRCQKIRDRYSRGESLALGKTTILDFVHQSKRNNVFNKA